MQLLCRWRPDAPKRMRSDSPLGSSIAQSVLAFYNHEKGFRASSAVGSQCERWREMDRWASAMSESLPIRCQHWCIANVPVATLSTVAFTVPASGGGAFSPREELRARIFPEAANPACRLAIVDPLSRNTRLAVRAAARCSFAEP